MNSQKFLQRGLLIWLLLCLLSSVLLYAEQIRRQFWDLDRAFAAAFAEAGAVLTQNESVLPLLNGNEDLAALRKKFPQILDLQKTQGRALDAARVEPVGEAQYWLYNPWRQIRVLIDTQSVIGVRPIFSRLSLDLRGDASPPPADAFWHWQRQFSQHTQPFILQADARPAWLNVALVPFLLLWLGWAGVIAAGGVILWQRKQRQNADQRARYYQHARLNTLGRSLRVSCMRSTSP